MGLQGRLESPAGVANPGNAHFEYQSTINFSINLSLFNNPLSYKPQPTVLIINIQS